MKEPLIRTLPSGALDIIGDVHGEFDILQNLLKHLGYDADGNHPQQRKVVFVGDFCDRGEDSPSVIFLIERWIKAGNAYAVLGNHEVNLLMGDAKDGSGWYFPQQQAKEQLRYQYRKVKEPERPMIENFLNQLPIALEREDIRIVHASWLPEKMNKIREMGAIDVRTLFRQWEKESIAQMKTKPWYRQYLHEKEIYQRLGHNGDEILQVLPAIAQSDYFRNDANPLQLALCGTEKIVTHSFFSAGRWRFTRRTPWWQEYTDNIPVVMGHYWRRWDEKGTLFPEEPNAWLGQKKNVFCIDFSVGKMWQIRQNQSLKKSTQLHLAALRWPEETLMFDNGLTAITLH